MALNSPSKPNRLSRRFAPANENGLSSYMAGALSPGGAVPQTAQLQFGGASSQPKISSAPAQTNTPAPAYTNDISTNTPVSTSGGGGGLKSYMDKMAALGSKAVPSAIEAAARQFNEENAFAKDAQGNFVLTPPDKEGKRYHEWAKSGKRWIEGEGIYPIRNGEVDTSTDKKAPHLKGSERAFVDWTQYRDEVESPEAIRRRLGSDPQEDQFPGVVLRPDHQGSAVHRAEMAEKAAKRIEELQGDVDEQNDYFSKWGEDPKWQKEVSERAERYRNEIAKLNAMRKAIIAGKGEDNMDAIQAAYPDEWYGAYRSQ